MVKKKLCINCGACVAVCPIKAIFEDKLGNVYVCIHCGRCVEFCPHNCLAMEPVGLVEEKL